MHIRITIALVLINWPGYSLELLSGLINYQRSVPSFKEIRMGRILPKDGVDKVHMVMVFNF